MTAPRGRWDEGVPESITTTWEFAVAQARMIHPIRSTFTFASRNDRYPAISKL